MKFTKTLVITGLAAVTLGGGAIAAHAAAGPKPAPAPAASATEQGVRLPLDYTEQQMLRLREDYNKCLKAQGVKFAAAPAVVGEGGIATPAAGQEAKVKRCADKQVLGPKEMDPKYNANYDRDFGEWVRLLNENGVKVKAVKGGWEYTETPKMNKSERAEIERRTRIQAFSN
ncbi:hypothetical protein [Nonomuraea typhae]|uniref:PASTA domain-containing protein n=1 Tax=Nonomuraea typhae TaxID=2603600 RepID=A0ABW7YTH6_9ACTN